MAEPVTVPMDDMALFRAATAPDPTPRDPPPQEAPAPPPVEEPPPAEPPPQPQPEPPPARTEESVPSWRLREEAEQRRLAEDRARAMEQRLREIAAHLQQQQQPAPEPAQVMQGLIMQHLQPFAEETRRNMMYMGKMVASQVHGADKVDAAEEAFLRARDNQSLDPADYERVVQSPNRYDAVVRWHRQQAALSTVGDDPAAWFEKQLESRLSDPQFQSQILEKLRGSASTRPATTELPPSLSRTTAVAGNSAPRGDLSDESLWAAVRRR